MLVIGAYICLNFLLCVLIVIQTRLIYPLSPMRGSSKWRMKPLTSTRSKCFYSRSISLCGLHKAQLSLMWQLGPEQSGYVPWCVYILLNFLKSEYLICFNCLLHVAVSFLGRANYLRDKVLDCVDDYQPYFVILIDKEESQIKRSEIMLKSWLNEVPCDEVSVLKGGIFLPIWSPFVLWISKK